MEVEPVMEQTSIIFFLVVTEENLWCKYSYWPTYWIRALDLTKSPWARKPIIQNDVVYKAIEKIFVCPPFFIFPPKNLKTTTLNDVVLAFLHLDLPSSSSSPSQPAHVSLFHSICKSGSSSFILQHGDLSVFLMGKGTITDYSKTQRIVFLIDLNPLFHLSDSTPYLTTLLSSIKTILCFPPLSSSLFSFKPFFSSLSPLLSCSKLPSFSFFGSLSFDLHEPTLSLLSRLFVSLEEIPISSNSSSAEATLPRGLHIAASMRQLAHEYAWDPMVRDPVMGKVLGCDDSVSVRSNLVVLLSPICRDFDSLAAFLNLGIDDQCLKDLDLFKLKFRGIFGSVNDAFVSRDIHFSWVDVKFESGSTQQGVEIGGSGSTFAFFESGIRDLGWGFSSTDSIVLGSALLPFGLIYPRIGISSYFSLYNERCKRVHVQLSLEILDVKGKPLQCKCCELELIVPRIFHENRLDGSTNLQTGCDEKSKRLLVEKLCDGVTKLHIKAVRRYQECVKIEEHLSEPVTVCEFLGESGSDNKGNSSNLHVNRILRILALEMGECSLPKSVPIWKILLSFLYREGYWALVALSSDKSPLCMGILKPFTVSSALLSIMNDEFYPWNMVQEFGGGGTELITKADYVISKSNADMEHSPFLDSQSGPASHGKHTAENIEKRKTSRKKLHLLQNLSWDAFCKAVPDHYVDLEDIFFATECDNSKKLKFMKCWMKQIKKSSSCSLAITVNSKPCEDITKQLDPRMGELLQESEQSIPLSASLGDNSNSLVEIYRVQEKDTLYYHSENSETLESFFCSLPDKIKQGVASEEVDVWALADRLVTSSIFWLCRKFEKKIESEAPVPKIENACGGMVAEELTRLLLREPKELFLMHKKNDPLSMASDSKNLIKEYPFHMVH